MQFKVWNENENETYRVALEICELIRSIGGRSLLVGGCVRDALLGKPCKDFDLECYGVSADDIQRVVGNKYKLNLVGVSFGVMKVHHYDIDIALPRVENKTGAGHRGFMVECVPELTYKEAAARRDFTMNAIMYDPLEDELIDPWGGREDLERNCLRHVSEHFAEDPLRVLRAAQFTARFQCQVAAETIEICRGIAQDELSRERLEGEWDKLLLKGTKPSLGLQFLKDCGWIRYYPELEALIGCEQTPLWHPEGDVWRHTMNCLDAAVDYRTGDSDEDRVLMLAVLCHDLGKPITSRVEADGRITSKGHDVAGEPFARSFISRIWNRTDLADKVVPFVMKHMAPSVFVQQGAGDKAYRQLALKVGRLDILRKVAECDIRSTGFHVEKRIAKLDAFSAKVEALQLGNSAPKPILLGRHLIELGVAPGPKMGQYFKAAFEAQLDGQFHTLEEAKEWARQNLIETT